MKGKVVWLLVTGLLATALVLISCGPAATTETPTTETPTTETPTTETPTTETPTTAPPTTAEPQYGGTLTLFHLVPAVDAVSWDAATLDWRNDLNLGPYQENLLMGDLNKGPRGTNEWDFREVQYFPNSVLRGCLAESWELAPDLKSVTFHLRKGVMWQGKPGVMNARELTADDVAFTFNRLFAAPAAPQFYYFCDKAVATDRYTVVIEFNEYSEIWWQYIGYGWYCQIYPPELVEAGIEDWKNAVGTGPWILTDYVSGSAITYERNPNYWDTETIDGKEYEIPFADRMVWPIVSDESTQMAALQTGKVDFAMGVSWRYVDIMAKTNPDMEVFEYLSGGNMDIALKVDKEPFNDINVRHALSMAIDREAYIKSQLGGKGEIVSSYLSARWEDVFTPLDELPAGAKEVFEYNPEKAKQLLTDAGYPDGFQAELVTLNRSGYIDICSMVADFWKKNLNVDVTLKTLEYATYLGVMYGKTYQDMMWYSTGVRYPALLLREMATPGQFWNPTNFDDPYYTEQAMLAVATADPAVQNPMLKELNVYLIEKCPYIPLPTSYAYSYAHPWVKNWYGEHNTGCYQYGSIFARIWIDRDLREEMTGKR